MVFAWEDMSAPLHADVYPIEAPQYHQWIPSIMTQHGLKPPSYHQATCETGWPPFPWPCNDPSWKATSILTRLQGEHLRFAAGRLGNSHCPLNNHHTKMRRCLHGLLGCKRENGASARVIGKHHRHDILGAGWADPAATLVRVVTFWNPSTMTKLETPPIDKHNQACIALQTMPEATFPKKSFPFVWQQPWHVFRKTSASFSNIHAAILSDLYPTHMVPFESMCIQHGITYFLTLNLAYSGVQCVSTWNSS